MYLGFKKISWALFGNQRNFMILIFIGNHIHCALPLPQCSAVSGCSALWESRSDGAGKRAQNHNGTNATMRSHLLKSKKIILVIVAGPERFIER